ncbi:asparagine synthetase B family protein [Desulfatitalea alkaliphila]|uniref:asparagine synthase (glutamine-hydrolyzing) n=1 Tax=Desulfatitalea alkaliphila TaxID=2929485 RepID=A0AA41R5Z2_9BACT|nr:asparagine synthetase B family protein [Desulfatitalea alkaliphila]MCJ8502098.1 asparagine synthase-related protein [Desulfatitalea alkaliphila]
MFAGIVSMNKNCIDKKVVDEIKSIFSAKSSLELEEKYEKSYFVIRGYTKALTKYPGIKADDNNSFSLLAGEPFLSEFGIEADHISINEILKNKTYAKLAPVRGVFCAARFINGQNPIFELCADKLGIRPIYYWSDNNFVIFSTALKVLETVSMIPKEVDQSALSEIFAFGIPLADRTRYKHIKAIREAEIVNFADNKTISTHYWRWDQIKQRDIQMVDALNNTYEIFCDAIKLRLKNDSSVLAFLSGGMDSRTIVATLVDMGVDVHTFNCSADSAQDKIFAKQFADVAGCPFHVMPYPEKSMSHMAKSVMYLSEEKKINCSRSQTIWSGDGGSVGLGCVYLDEYVVEQFRCSDQLDAIQYFNDKNSYALPIGVIKTEKKQEYSKLLQNAISKELGRIECEDKGQKIFLFLMFNDQRRHLHNIYENLDFHGTEYQLPFFDSLLLEYVLSLPLDYRLNHKMYHELFRLFPSIVYEVPWQTYPGHVPCPLPIERDLEYQWDRTNQRFFDRIKKQTSEGIEGFKVGIFARTIDPLNRAKYLFVVLAHLLCLKNFDYIIKAGKIFAHKT